MNGVWRSLASARALGARGRGFESRHPDQFSQLTGLIIIAMIRPVIICHPFVTGIERDHRSSHVTTRTRTDHTGDRPGPMWAGPR